MKYWISIKKYLETGLNGRVRNYAEELGIPYKTYKSLIKDFTREGLECIQNGGYTPIKFHNRIPEDLRVEVLVYSLTGEFSHDEKFHKLLDKIEEQGNDR